MFFGIVDIWAYVAGAFLIILLPGPNSVFVLTTAARRGARNGRWAAVGVFAGDSALMILAALGAASLLRAAPALFLIVQYAGAAYLAWLGFGLLRAARKAYKSPERADTSPLPPGDGETDSSPGGAFRRALLISLLNPKAIVFFVSFFIQFVDPSYGAPALSFLILGAICQLFSVIYLSALIYGGAYLAAQFRARRRMSATLTAGVGAVFVGFGAALATSGLG